MIRIETCVVPGCGRHMKLGYMACARHVRQRKRELRRDGRRVVVERARVAG